MIRAGVDAERLQSADAADAENDFPLDARIAVSEAARDFVDSYFPAHYEIVPNGISLERFNPAVPPLPQLMDGRKNILFLGRYNEPRKGFRFLVRAFPAVRRQFPEARLVVVGQGDRDRPDGVHAAAELGREPHGEREIPFALVVTDSPRQNAGGR